MECARDILAPINHTAVHRHIDTVLKLPTGMSTQKRKRNGDGGYVGQLTPFRNARYKRSRTAGTYSRTKRRSAYSRRNPRSGGFLGVEKKYYDTTQSISLTAPADATGGEVNPASGALSVPAQGDGATNRDGKQIIAKYLAIKGVINAPNMINQTALPAGTKVFVAIVLDTQTNASQVNSEDVFTNTLANAVGNAMLQRDLEYGSRFKILKSEVFDIEPYTATWDGTNIEVGGRMQCFDWYIPLNNLKINFNSGTTASIANVTDNSIQVIAFATSTAQAPTLSYNARLRFIG